MLDVARQTDVTLRTIASPFGEIAYLLSQIAMPRIIPRFARGPEPLGSSRHEWPKDS